MRGTRSVKNTPVLVLNAAFEAIDFADLQRAMKLVVKGKAIVVLEHEDKNIHPDYMMPSIVRLSEYRHIPHQHVTPQRHNILLRDNYTCQYCFQPFKAYQLTLDHVIPRAQGGQSTWENLVAACSRCNRIKADRTPEQANMELLHQPRRMTIHTSRSMLRMIGSVDPAWREYLYH